MGWFIAIDGPNGVGKTTYIGLLVSSLNKNYNVITTKEPTDTPYGNMIRLNEGGVRGLEYAKLIATDRLFHIKNEVLPALETGSIIISDRYIASSLALQYLDGVSLEEIWLLNKDIIEPDLYVILSANPETIEERIRKRDTLTYFEKTKSRKDELKAFSQAYEYLKSKRWNVVWLDNSNTEQLTHNVDYISTWFLENK